MLPEALEWMDVYCLAEAVGSCARGHNKWIQEKALLRVDGEFGAHSFRKERLSKLLRISLRSLIGCAHT